MQKYKRCCMPFHRFHHDWSDKCSCRKSHFVNNKLKTTQAPWDKQTCYRLEGHMTFRPGSDSARKNMDVSAKSMDVSAKEYRRFGQRRWTFRPKKMDVSARKCGRFGQTKMDISAKYIFNSFTNRILVLVGVITD